MANLNDRFIYIRNIVIRFSLVVFIGVALIIFWESWNGKPLMESLKIYGVVTIVLIVCASFIANAFWNAEKKSATYPRKAPTTRPTEIIFARPK